jgi:hypothetical protein
LIVYDPLYGPFQIPSYLVRLVQTPEVRRLSQIRLLNSLSPSVATLGEIRRYSHTLGVLHLCTLVKVPEYSEEERRALAASVLLHDIGTPPFGHLLEYHLKERRGWSHEDVIRSVLWGCHMPENTGHQMFAGQAIEFSRRLRSAQIRLDIVEAIVTRKHPLALLLFGSVDLDNLDNVARMAWALGLGGGSAWATHLAANLGVTQDFRLQLSVESGRQAVRSWSSVRRSVYDILIFDPPTAAAQAVLSDAIGLALEQRELDQNDWALTDEALLNKLREFPRTKLSIIKEYLGREPSIVFAVQLNGSLSELGFPDREAAKLFIEQILAQEFVTGTPLGYVFVDHGTFQKRLQFVDQSTNDEWAEGEDSRTVVLYGFLRAYHSPARGHCRRAAEQLLAALHVNTDLVRRVELGGTSYSSGDQIPFNFTSSED